MTSSPSLILPADTEFLDGLRFLCGDGVLADIKRQLVPIALDVIRNSLVGHTHPFETLQSLGDMHWQDLVENPHTSSLINRLLDEIELHPRLQGVVDTLRHPAVMHRTRVEWLHEMTVGRFEHSIPFLHQEDELLKDWEQFCGELRESSINPFETADEEAQRYLSSRGDTLSDSARRLHRLSFLAACRKLFVHFSGAKETWAGSYMFHSFKPSGALADQMGHAARDVQGRGEYLSLRFGQVDHVFYLKPSLEQLQLYRECIKDPELTTAVQRKLCPFICLDREEMNFLAELFYRIYLPGCLREIHHPSQMKIDEAFLQESGMKKEFFGRFRFLPLTAEIVAMLSEKMEELPRLRAFLHHPRTESGLARQRLYRGILGPMLTDVVQKSLPSLCRQWNPLLRTEEGATLLLMNCVESKACRVAGNDPKAALLRERVIFDELLKILDRNTLSWQEAFARDGFVVDRSRAYFMSVLDKAIEESDPEQTRRPRYRDSRRVACVVVE
jgi:hypothetical protein